ncbi:hypothetical protein AAFF_G00152280 [Aldrovandia affinis]|uniref:Fibronectin type-III domain-containing protein n=1 Tax=Aldrovandia affinis TaxID=143900 RepID=A0AAD7RP31_9TELE|nr:hypothetical protein AAFF_G00152280 [Aldrovandia affinis]
MDVAVAEEPQKKIFRARKTMKISDRQQLESLHNSLSSSVPPSSSSSSSPPPPLVNGKHPDEGQMETEKDKEKTENNADSSLKEARPASPASRSPTPLALSLSLSPSPPAKTPEEALSSTPPPSPSRSGDPDLKDTEEGEGDEGKLPAGPSAEGGEKKDVDKDKEEEEEEEEGKSSASAEEEKQDDLPKPQESPQEATAMSPAPPVTSEGTEEDKEKATETSGTAESKETVTMDTGPLSNAPEDGIAFLDKMAAASSHVQSPAPPANPSPSPSLSPSHAPESDQEVKEGFLVLSEEEESAGEKDEGKEKAEDKDEQDEEKMEVDVEKEGKKEDCSGITAPVSPTSASPAGSTGEEAGEQDGARAPSAKKRTMSRDSDSGGLAEGAEDERPEGPESQRKRPRVEREELEAHLELKISGNSDSRHKLEKVVQQLVAEQLRALQLSVFDRSLQELKERVEKLDCATKHQHTLNTLQAKIARLTKKFGAANQAKENTRKPQEMLSPSSSSAAATPTATTNSTPAQRTVRSMLDSKRAEQPGQNQTPSPTGPAVPPKVLSAQTSASSSLMQSAPVLSLIATSSSASPTASVTNTSQTQPLTIKTNTPNSPVTPSAVATTPKPVSLQPLLIQLPLSVTNAQGGALMANHSSGVELVPVTSLAGSLPSSPSLPQITLARAAAYPGSSGTIGAPSSAVSVTSARTPTQCISAVGATSSSSLPTSSTPAATGGQSSGATASAPLSGAAMASKTDNQAANRAPDSTTSKSPAQAPRTSRAGAVIDLTEDDDDVLVTGVKKAPVQSGPNVTASPSSSSPSLVAQRGPVGPPPLTSHTTLHAQPNAQTTVNVLQRCQAVAPRQPAGHRSHSEVIPSEQPAFEWTTPHRTPSPPTGLANKKHPLRCHDARPHLQPQPPAPKPPAPALLTGPTRPPAPEATHTSPPQQPQLKLARVQSQNGIVLSWCVEETDRTCATVDSYHLYAYHQDHSGPAGASSPASQWKKIGEVKALPLPMACTLTQFVSGSKYYFAVRARDIYSRFGPFCEPQCTDVITPSTASS